MPERFSCESKTVEAKGAVLRVISARAIGRCDQSGGSDTIPTNSLSCSLASHSITSDSAGDCLSLTIQTVEPLFLGGPCRW